MNMTAQSEMRDRWFLGTRVNLRRLSSEGADGVSIIEHHQRFGMSPPRHIHHDEDEVFHVIDGRIRFAVGEREFEMGPGETCVAPRGVPHSFKVVSEEGARSLTIVIGDQFENYVRKVSVPDDPLAAVKDSTPTDAEIKTMVEAGAEHRIEFVGPPLH
jgi:mannose-6-phosphate isomerase-like protein (cupin superfamily)